MDLNQIHQVFKSIVDDFNLEDGQNRGWHLDYHIFSGVIDSVVYELEITILATQEKVSPPCYILPEDKPKNKNLKNTWDTKRICKDHSKCTIMESQRILMLNIMKFNIY